MATVGNTSRMLPMFATPLLQIVLDDHAAIDRALRSAILARREADRGVTISNVGGWQSRNDLRQWGGEAAARLAAAVLRLADAAIAPAEPGGTVAWTPEMWANVNARGASNQTHWHPGSFASAVYYVDDGYAGSADPALGGEIAFVDPRMPYLRMRTPDLHVCSADGATAGQETWLRPSAGLLVLFPSFLSHSVRAYRGEGLRITIAINLVARLAA